MSAIYYCTAWVDYSHIITHIIIMIVDAAIWVAQGKWNCEEHVKRGAFYHNKIVISS